jgi:hypothetical protein
MSGSEPIRLDPAQLRELAALIAEELRGSPPTADGAASPLVGAAELARQPG